MKKFLATVMALFMSFAFVTTAFAGSINSEEAKLRDEAQAAFSPYMSASRMNTYLGVANSALSNDAIDLDAAACNDLRNAINDIKSYLSGKDAAYAKAHVVDIAAMINKYSKKYNMTVVAYANGDVAVQIAGKTAATTSSTNKIVKQTGADFAQTAAVAVAAVAVLGGAYVFARKNRLFA